MSGSGVSSQEARWIFPPETRLLSDDDYADLETIDISAIDLQANPSALTDEQIQLRDDTVRRALKAFSEGLGLVYVVGHGLTEDDIQRQYDIGSVFFDHVSNKEKGEYIAKIIEEGSWAGYKPQGYYNRPDGTHDVDENFNFYPQTMYASQMPQAARQYLDEYRKFLENCHYVVVGKMLYILSLGLGLPHDALWRLHHRGGYNIGESLRGPPNAPIEWNHSQDHFRFQLYGKPSEEDMLKKPERLWLRSHWDYGTLTLNYSQPISALQVFTTDRRWAWVRPKPGAIVVNLGSTMEFITAGQLKAAFHRVAEPPEDQRRFRRFGIHYFVKLLPDVRIDIPLISGGGGVGDPFREYRELGGAPLKYKDWEAFRTKWGYTQRPSKTVSARTPEDVLFDLQSKENP